MTAAEAARARRRLRRAIAAGDRLLEAEPTTVVALKALRDQLAAAVAEADLLLNALSNES